MSSLAVLQQRKQEVISQLEKVVGKTAALAISNNANTLARQESIDCESSITFWTGQINSGPTFVRSDSILKDDDYVPVEAPCVGRFGPISRMHKEGGNSSVAQFCDSSISSHLVSCSFYFVRKKSPRGFCAIIKMRTVFTKK